MRSVSHSNLEDVVLLACIMFDVILYYRLIPSTATLSYEDPVPAPPPPGYESGFPITDEDLVKGSSENKCSTTEVESRL